MKAQNSDWQLLQDYVERGSQAAFATLVERHVNFVYSTCLREVRDAALAEDVTQVVFLILARKAHNLRETGTLSGWLYKTSCFACKNAMKQERARQRHEQNLIQELRAETENPPQPNDDWSHLEELLHDALSHLNNKQRNIVFLRFFEGKSVRETGEALGITEKAAERRLARALEKMRRYVASCGYTVSLAALTTLLTENAVQAAPAACLASALQMAQSVAAGGGVTTAATSSTVVSLSQGVLKAMLMNQIKTGIVASIGFAVMTASTVKIAHLAMAGQEKKAPNSFIRASMVNKAKTLSIWRSATTKTTAQTAKNQTESPILQSSPKRPLVRIAQPRLPAIKPEEKPSVAPEAAPEKPKVEIVEIEEVMPQAGEIAVEGPLIAISNGRLIIDVTSYTLSNGKVNPVNPAKPKAIIFTAKTPLHVRGSATKVKVNDLKPAAFIRAIGTDKGTGEPLPARDMAVWDSAKNGVYSWGAAPQNTPPQTTIIETAEAADVPPDGENRPYINQFLQGDFQKVAAGQVPPGWTVGPGIAARVQEKDGKKWLAITNNTAKNWGTLRYKLPLAPDWKRLRVSAQLKVKNLKNVTEWWHTSRLDFNILDAKDQVLSYGRGLNLWKNSDWTTLHKFIVIPEGATSLSLEPGFFYSTGELLIDNIRVEANVPIEARPIREGFPEGTFENIEGSGWPEGFEPWIPETLKMVEENGNHFVRLTGQPPGQSSGLDGRFALPPQWKRVKVKARVRLTNYTRGAKNWETAKIGVVAEDETSQVAGNNLKPAEISPSEQWTTVEITNPVPKGATMLNVRPQLSNSIGVLDVDDLEILDATNDDLPHLGITPDLPGGQFEELDEKGWPKGWIKEAGQPEMFQVGVENGNHFLRLSSPKPYYAAVKARFKLPDNWRAVKLRGRIRVKNLVRESKTENWKTTRVGFIFQNKHGERVGGFLPSLELHADSDWQELEVKADIARDAVYIELAAVLQNSGGIFDVDDLKLEQATPTVKLAPIYEWTRAFPEGTFELQDENGAPLHWTMNNRAQILQEDGNKFLRLTSESIKDTVFVSGAWKIKPEWKSIRVRARMRGANLKKGASPFDGARMQIIFMDANDNPLASIPPPIELKKDSDWLDLQTQVAIPPGATSIKLLPSLSRSSGLFDVDDVLIEPILN